MFVFATAVGFEVDCGGSDDGGEPAESSSCEMEFRALGDVSWTLPLSFIVVVLAVLVSRKRCEKKWNKSKKVRFSSLLRHPPIIQYFNLSPDKKQTRADFFRLSSTTNRVRDLRNYFLLKKHISAYHFLFLAQMDVTLAIKQPILSYDTPNSRRSIIEYINNSTMAPVNSVQVFGK